MSKYHTNIIIIKKMAVQGWESAIIIIIKKISNARLGQSNLLAPYIGPDPIAAQYQPIKRMKGKEEQ